MVRYLPVFIIFYFMHNMLQTGSAASIDIEINIDVSQNNENIIDGRPKRHNEPPKFKKHFLDFRPEDFVTTSRNGGADGGGKLNSQSKIRTRATTTESENQSATYPKEEIRRYLEANPYLLKYLAATVPNIVNRGGGEEDEGENMCNSYQDQFYAPQSLKNTRGELKTIINDENNFQYVEREICASDFGGRCKTFNLLGYTSYCVQKYSIRRLLIYDGNKTNSETSPFGSFSIPSCCVCRLKPNKD